MRHDRRAPALLVALLLSLFLLPLASGTGQQSVREQSSGDECASSLGPSAPAQQPCGYYVDYALELLGPCEDVDGASRCLLGVSLTFYGMTTRPALLDLDAVLMTGRDWETGGTTVCNSTLVGTWAACGARARVYGWTVPGGCADILLMGGFGVNYHQQSTVGWVHWLCQHEDGSAFLMAPGPWPFP